jgi:predicted transcriptional regulator
MEQKVGTGRVQVHAHIEPVVRAELLIIAKANDRSLAGEIRQAIREHVEREATAANPRGVTDSTTSRPAGAPGAPGTGTAA